MKRLLPILLLFLLTAATAQAKQPRWIRLDTEHFALIFPDNEAPAAAAFAQSAERLRTRVAAAYELDKTAKVEIRLAPDRATFNALQDGRHAPEWSVGTAQPEKMLIVMFSPAGSWKAGIRGDAAEVFQHELSHIYLYVYLNNRRAPRWLDEGLARTVSGEWRTGDATRLTMALLIDRLIPLRDLVDNWPGGGERAKLAYAESHSLVMYLRQKKWLPAVLLKMKEGATSTEALRLATGVGLGALEKRWHDYLRRHHTYLTVLDQGVLWFLAALLLVVGYVLVKIRRRRQYENLDDDLPPKDPNRVHRLRRYDRRPRLVPPPDERMH